MTDDTHLPPVIPDDAAGTSPADAAAASPSPPKLVFSGAWEQELLISGVVVFALLQVPGALQHRYARMAVHLDGPVSTAAAMAYGYGMLILYTLISSFLANLAARAYWVGLIGLHSVFPGGVRWEKVRQGPITVDEFRRRLPTLPRLIAAADDFCSVIFSVAFMLVLMFGISILWGGALVVVSWLAARTFMGGAHASDVFAAMMAILLVPALAFTFDRMLGRRLRPGGVAERLVRGGVRTSQRLMMMPLYQPILLVLFSNVRRRAAYPAFYALVAALVGFYVLNDSVIGREGLMLESARFAPSALERHGVDARTYEDQRPEDEIDGVTPSIPTDVIVGPFVRLFIPYTAGRHDAAAAERCPGLRPFREAGLHREATDTVDRGGDVAALLACLARLQPVRLNGRPLASVPFRFRTDPRTGVRGIVGYVPTQALPRGENVLEIGPSPLPKAREKDEKEKTRQPYIIRFWL
jgi:hypothetical protein